VGKELNWIRCKRTYLEKLVKKNLEIAINIRNCQEKYECSKIFWLFIKLIART